MNSPDEQVSGDDVSFCVQSTPDDIVDIRGFWVAYDLMARYPMTHEGDHILGDILKSPEDWPLYLIYADWLEDQAEAMQLRLANRHQTTFRVRAYRWMGRRQKHPEHRLRYPGTLRTVPDRFSWAWHRDDVATEAPDYAVLPYLVFLATLDKIFSPARYRVCHSWNAAVDLLAVGLNALREAATP